MFSTLNMGDSPIVPDFNLYLPIIKGSDVGVLRSRHSQYTPRDVSTPGRFQDVSEQCEINLSGLLFPWKIYRGPFQPGLFCDCAVSAKDMVFRGWWERSGSMFMASGRGNGQHFLMIGICLLSSPWQRKSGLWDFETKGAMVSTSIAVLLMTPWLTTAAGSQAPTATALW